MEDCMRFKLMSEYRNVYEEKVEKKRNSNSQREFHVKEESVAFVEFFVDPVRTEDKETEVSRAFRTP